MKIWVAKITHHDSKTGKISQIGFDVKMEPTKGYDCFILEQAFDDLDAENEVLVNALLDMGKLCDNITTELLKKRKEAQDAFLESQKKIIQLTPK